MFIAWYAQDLKSSPPKGPVQFVQRPRLAVCGCSGFGQTLAAQVRSSITYEITRSMLPLFGEQ